jgi:hypothetical protein
MWRHDRRSTSTGTRRKQHGSQETSEKEPRPDNGRGCPYLEHDPFSNISRCDRYDSDGRDIGISLALLVRGEAIYLKSPAVKPRRQREPQADQF